MKKLITMTNVTRPQRKRWSTLSRLVPAMCLSVLLASCGGGGSSDEGDGGIVGTGIILDGTAAPERMLAENSVDIRSKSGQRFNAPIDNTGRFQANFSEAETPLLMRVDLGNGDFQYSIAAKSSGTDMVSQNIHSYTDAVARNWFASRGLNIDSEFDATGALSQTPTLDQLASIKSVLFDTVGLVLGAYDLAGVDLATSSFSTDNTGIDVFLVNNPVLINNGTINVYINDPTTNTQSVAVDELAVDTDLTVADVDAPSVPTNVRALAASETDIVVVWEPSKDNIGVSEYQVFRDGELVATTPFPLFSDQGLSTGVAYSYTVIAVDAAGNASAASDMQTSNTLSEPDTTAPLAPQGLLVSADNQSAAALWGHADISDVVKFRVVRTSVTAASAEVNTTATFFTDAQLMSGTEYCYAVIALDASGNESAPSATNCTTTTGSVIVTIGGTGSENGEGTENNSGNEFLALSASSYQVLESSPSVTITVVRTGGNADQTSVDYVVEGVTAVDGEDFSATSGTLTWAAGDDAPKTFTVQIAFDALEEVDETFQIILSNVSGNAMLGDIQTAVVTISNVSGDQCFTVLETTIVNENTTLELPCYLVNTNLRVLNGTLTINPGVTLKFAANTNFEVTSGGTLIAEGTATNPIVLTGQDSFAGAWTGLRFNQSNSPRNSLAHAVIEFGGVGFVGGDANLYVNVNSRVSVVNTIIRHSFADGFHIARGAELIKFDNVISTDNSTPGKMAWLNMPAVSSTNDFSGNTTDRLSLLSDGNLQEASVWPTVNVPMHVPATVRTFAPLTISPGNTLIFATGAQLTIDTNASLTSIGTAAEPIVFTADQPIAGYWRGIVFVSNALPSEMRYTTVEYGGESDAAGNLNLRGCSGTTFFGMSISDSSFNNSAGFGIHRNGDTCDLQIGENVSYFGNAAGELNQ